jgi:hypothetical protein
MEIQQANRDVIKVTSSEMKCAESAKSYCTAILCKLKHQTADSGPQEAKGEEHREFRRGGMKREQSEAGGAQEGRRRRGGENSGGEINNNMQRGCQARGNKTRGLGRAKSKIENICNIYITTHISYHSSS